MGGVQIKNCTAVPLKIQLCQIGVLYHGLVQPDEYFVQETGAAHFTIRITVSDRDDTSECTDMALPVLQFIVSIAAAAVATSASFGALAPLGIPGAPGPVALVSGGPVSKSAIAEATGVIAGEVGLLLAGTIGPAMNQNTKKGHFSMSSPGWYFGGINELEVRGGPAIANGGMQYAGSELYIVDRNNPYRHS